MHIARYLFIMTIFCFCGTSIAADPVFGKWHMKTINEGYIFPSTSDIDYLSSRGIIFPEAAPWPCNFRGENCGWAIPGPLLKGPEYQPYALFLREYGYILIETTRNGNTEHLKWGWKMSVENKSKNNVLARAYCTLYDNNDFPLAADNNDDSVGTFIWKGKNVTFQDEVEWSFSSNTKPYPPGRVAYMKCTLLLRHVH